MKCLFCNNEDRDNILMYGLLWACGTDYIINVQVTNIDAKSNRSKDLRKALAAHGREMMKKKCLAVKKLLVIRRLAENGEKPCFEVCGLSMPVV